MPSITICICTLDRADDLQRGLEALLLNEGIQSIELIVVNNGPGEVSRNVVERYSNRLSIRYIRLETPGLGAARNTLWQSATGEWMAYLDDDSIVYPSWLAGLQDAIAKVESRCFAIAGNVDMGSNPPILPKWCSPNLAQTVFSNVNFGTEERYLDFPSVPLGNNMVLRRSFLAQNGGFLTDSRTYDDVYVGWMGYRLGGSCYFTPRMRVAHCPSVERISKKWVLGKYRQSGRGFQVVLSKLRGFNQLPSLYGFIFYLPLVTIKWGISLLLNKPSLTINFLALMNFEVGRAEYFFLSKKGGEYAQPAIKVIV
jgi:glycosyltransferase involved in cell wall biosynthesis